MCVYIYDYDDDDDDDDDEDYIWLGFTELCGKLYPFLTLN